MTRHTIIGTARRATTAGLTIVLTAGLGAAVGALPAAAEDVGPSVSSLYPSNSLTVRDRSQRTGLRIALPTSGCRTVSACGMIARLNELDGFDLDPRLAVRFDGPVDPARIAARISVRRVGHGPRIGVERVVYDAATHTVYAHPQRQLAPGSTYRLTVRSGRATRSSVFTTFSATDGLRDLARQVQRTRPANLRVEASVDAAGTTLQYLQDTGAADLTATPVPTTGLTGRITIGSFLAPSWLGADGTIAQTPTKDTGPRPTGTTRLPFVLTTPRAERRGGWPVVVFGHGFTGNLSNTLATAEANQRRGIATIATTVPGHGSGPRSAWRITTAAGTTTVPAYGRGRDVDGLPGIGTTDGASPRVGTEAATVGFRDTLRQAALDNMSLRRAVAADRTLGLSARGIDYWGISFGGIYGTMTVGTDRGFDRAVLTVPGGPISEIARLSPDFRPLAAVNLQAEGLLNGGSVGFTESLPLPGDDPVTDPAPGSLAIQQFLADSTWLQRSGSPETFAPSVRHRSVLYQVARGDRTVANPTSFTLLRAGHLQRRTTLYRNDLTDAAAANPHGFPGLAPIFATARAQGLGQTAEFLATGRTIDPDGRGRVWETPVRDLGLLRTTGF